MSSKLSNIYAKSLIMIAEDKGDEPDNYLKALKQIDGLLSEEWMKQFLAMPNISVSQKSDIIQEIVNNLKLDAVLGNFLIFLLDNGRINIFGNIVKSFENYCDDLYGRVSGIAISAVKLAEKEKKGVKDALSGLTGKKVDLSYKIDENIWGGIVIYAGNIVYDGSVRHIVAKLRQEFGLIN
ncbi:MAG: ATP synthase F1 subunit delta [Epsilonproteobacteria bacterium]|nr:ATP synthase F1 subunit delta [Campylobacterota bacterium]